ncbi:MAG: MerR family transcriptional regulator [Gammaproteobacteria bacterium]|nr:MerR family transcriptional regulator [Gammaproteobacteria bacterium]
MGARRLHTVGEVATLAGVTVRTLHYYDRVGLLVPSGRSEGGYRLYAYGDLERLREIRLLRELGFSLAAIGRLLDVAAHDKRSALKAQRDLLVERLERTERIIRGVDRALNATEEGQEMDETEMFEGLEEFDHKRYEAEVEQRWGDSEAYKESKRRTSRYGKADWARIKKEGDAVVRRLAELLARGVRADDREAMDLAEEHRRHIDRWFYPCSPGMHRQVAALYTADTRFEAYFEKHGAGLAGFFQAAIRANEVRSTG